MWQRFKTWLGFKPPPYVLKGAGHRNTLEYKDADIWIFIPYDFEYDGSRTFATSISEWMWHPETEMGKIELGNFLKAYDSREVLSKHVSVIRGEADQTIKVCNLVPKEDIDKIKKALREYAEKRGCAFQFTP